MLSDLTGGRRSARPVAGFTLLEVLIALLILSVGLLGLAGLQASGIRTNHSAYLRTQATISAADIADRMRANRQAALAGAYDLAIDADPPSPSTKRSDADLIDWRGVLSTRLPDGVGSVQVNANGTVTIVVQWDDTRGEGDLTAFRMQTRL